MHADRSASLWWNGTRGAGRAPLATALAALLLAPALGCGGDDSTPNVIIPITATATLDPDPPGDPVIYLQKVSEVGDLVTVNVRLRTSSPIQFDAFTFEARYDPGLLTLGGASFFSTILCACDDSDLTCTFAGDVSCLIAPATTAGELSIGVASLGLDPDFDTMTATDVNLVTLAFRAGAVTPPGGTRVDILMPSPPEAGCAILNELSDLGVPCATGLTITAQR